MENNEMRYCNQCPNHCPENALKCGRGRNYFSRLDNPEEENREAEIREGEAREGGWHGHHGHGDGDEGREHGHHGHHDHGDGNEGREGGWHGHHGHGDGDEGGEGRRGRGPHLDQNDLYSMMRFCGHYLYHRSGSVHGAGQERILSILSEKESITQKELQSILKIQPGSMSEILSKLEEKGMISRKKDEEDRRKSVIELTDEGREAGSKAKHQPESELFGALDENEQEALRQLLRKLTDSWKDQ